ncbi:MAG TPA: hypothetical protein VLG74_09785 [Blastocatellia bacterium]|nr:hypothetical protein [Blastocatellia bacterium]
MSPTSWLAALDDGASREFEKAWFLSGDGTTAREGVLLIFRMSDGSYRAKLQPLTNQYRQCTFRWNPAAIAIVHTHPNSCDPKPAEQDRQVADKYGVPNFTITIRGMYVYDPATKKTSKLMNGLDWLNLPSIQMNSRGGSAPERIRSLSWSWCSGSSVLRGKSHSSVTEHPKDVRELTNPNLHDVRNGPELKRRAG